MKTNHLLVFLMTILSEGIHSQIVISQPELFIFYKGYMNKFDAASKNGLKEITLVSPDFTFSDFGTYYQEKRKEKSTNSEQQIAIPTGNPGPSKIYMLNAKNQDTIDVFDVEIRVLPDPDLFFGGAATSDIASINETRFFAKYGPEIPLNVSFTILKGKMLLQSGKEFTFTGGQITKDIQETLIAQGRNSEITVELEVKGPDGLTRNLKGTWKL
jgi:hypothetical protein